MCVGASQLTCADVAKKLDLSRAPPQGRGVFPGSKGHDGSIERGKSDWWAGSVERMIESESRDEEADGRRGEEPRSHRMFLRN